MRITVVGAGNVGTQVAVHCAENKHKVTIFGSKPERIKKVLSIIDENGNVIHRGTIYKATSDPKIAFEDSDLIIVTMPSHLMLENARKIEPFIKSGMKICLIPGTGGGECAFKKCEEKGAIIFGVQRAPSVARLVEYGKVVRAVGYRDKMYVSSIPGFYCRDCCSIIEQIFNIQTDPLPNYLNITLTPSNPILHTTRLRVLFDNYKNEQRYASVPLFYEDWNDTSSELLLKCDSEVQQICRSLKQYDLSYVKSLKVHYESNSIEEMTKKISGIKGFKGLESPVIRVGNMFIPDFNSRYFTSDFSYGLAILVQIAEFIGVNTPNMNETLNWYFDVTDNKGDYFKYSDYGIKGIDDFFKFYSMSNFK